MFPFTLFALYIIVILIIELLNKFYVKKHRERFLRMYICDTFVYLFYTREQWIAKGLLLSQPVSSRAARDT